MTEDGGGLVEGVEALDHTADVGIRVRAPDLPTLLARAALGALALAVGRAPETGDEPRLLRVSGDDPAELLRRWLREVLLLHEVEGFLAGAVERLEVAPSGDGLTVEATLLGGPAPEHPAREIKGVTWHGLLVEESEDGGLLAQVIFDV